MAVVSDGSKRFQVDEVVGGASSGFDVWELFGELLQAAGWTAVDYSDGTTVATSTTRATVLEIDNVDAWQRMRAPAGTFEVVWQRGATERQWRMFFCQSGYNADGLPTVLPTEVDTEVQVVGLAGAYDTDFTGNTSTDRRWNMCADSVPGQPGIYYMHMFSTLISTGAEQDRWCFTPKETGSFVPEDTAPWLLLHAASGGTVVANVVWTAHFKRGLAGDAITLAALSGAHGNYPSLGVTNPWNGGQDFTRVRIHDAAGADEGQYGDCLDVFWPASPTGVLPKRATINLATAWGLAAGGDPGALYRLDDLLVPWPSTVTPTP